MFYSFSTLSCPSSTLVGREGVYSYDTVFSGGKWNCVNSSINLKWRHPSKGTCCFFPKFSKNKIALNLTDIEHFNKTQISFSVPLYDTMNRSLFRRHAVPEQTATVPILWPLEFRIHPLSPMSLSSIL